MLKVISFFAGPGSGKSTLAASLFAFMKRQRYSVELVTEYAKELTYEENWQALKNQLRVFNEQHCRQQRLIGKVEWAITDSPLPLSLVYGGKESYHLKDRVQSCWDMYENFAFLLERTRKPYVLEGRKESEAEARLLDNKIYDAAREFGATRWVDPDAPNVEELIVREVIAMQHTDRIGV